MNQNYTEDQFVDEELSNEELFHKHVVKNDLDLIEIDKLLSDLYSQIDVE